MLECLVSISASDSDPNFLLMLILEGSSTHVAYTGDPDGVPDFWVQLGQDPTVVGI